MPPLAIDFSDVFPDRLVLWDALAGLWSALLRFPVSEIGEKSLTAGIMTGVGGPYFWRSCIAISTGTISMELFYGMLQFCDLPCETMFWLGFFVTHTAGWFESSFSVLELPNFTIGGPCFWIRSIAISTGIISNNL